jgi:hypothetical protein
MLDPTIDTSDYDLYGGHPPHVAGSDTSIDAADRIKEHVGKIARKVFNMIAASGDLGMTVDEIEAASGLKHQTAGPRVREMVMKGILRATENRRLTRSKRYGTVYVVTGDDPAPSVATRTDWKAIAVELFDLLIRVESVNPSSNEEEDIWEAVNSAHRIARERVRHMTLDAAANPQPVRKP